MSIRMLNTVMNHSQARGSTRMLLMVLASFADDAGGQCFPSKSTLGRLTKLTPRQIQRHIQSLYDLGEIGVMQAKGRTNTNNYTILLTPPIIPEKETSTAEKETSTTIKGDMYGSPGETCTTEKETSTTIKGGVDVSQLVSTRQKGHGEESTERGQEPPPAGAPPVSEGDPDPEPEPPAPPPVLITQAMVLAYVEKLRAGGADYTDEEALRVWRFYHGYRTITTGDWCRGRMKVTDWRMVLETDIQGHRERMGTAGPVPTAQLGPPINPTTARMQLRDTAAELTRQIQEHSANRDSTHFNPSRTEAELTDFLAKNARLREVRQMLAGMEVGT